MAADPAIKFVLSVLDHVCRRYLLPLILVAATVLRFNLFSLVYLILFLVGVVITGPRQKNKRVGIVAYLIITLSAAVIFVVSQLLFQITLATGPSLDYCETLEVILRQIGLVQFDVITVLDIFRYLSFDVLIIVSTAVSLGIVIKLSTLHDTTPESSTTPNDGATPPNTPSTMITEQSNLSNNTTSYPQSYFRLPQWTLVVIDLLIFFLFLLCGTTVPSIVSFWYFAMFLVLCTMWSVHFKHTSSVARVLKTISMFFTAIHIIVLYLYQFQSFQLDAPAMSYTSTDQLLVRLFGLTPLIETDCKYPAGLALWDNVPLSTIMSPWSLLALYWLLASDCHLWFTTPQPFWSLYSTYCLPKLPSPTDTLRIQRKGRSGIQHYGAVDTDPENLHEVHEQSVDKEDDVFDADNDKTDSMSEIEESLYSKPYATVMAIKEKIVHHVIELWNILMSLSYVFSLVAMMVWSVLYPSWPALVLLLWAVAIWVIPRINPKQSLQYSSPFLVVYAIGLLILSYVNALPVTTDAFTWDFKVGIECKYHDEQSIEDCLSWALISKSLLSLAFFASLRQLINERINKRKHQGDYGHAHHLVSAIDNDDKASDINTTASKVFLEIYAMLKVYWIVVVLASFLLVILVGQPSALKSVYLISLYVFFLFYQLFRKWWVIISYPLWWLLVVYAALHLVIVYTFQLNEISDLWYKLADQQNFTQERTQEIFLSVGLTSNDSDNARALFDLLVPLAIFTAVIALQVRYFSSRELPTEMVEMPNRLTLGQVLSGVTQAFTLTPIEFEPIQKDIERKEKERQRRRSRIRSSQQLNGASPDSIEEVNTVDIAEDWEMTGSRETTPTDPSSVTFTRFLIYSLIKLRQFIIIFWHFFWRFFEIHTGKLVIVAIFAYGLYEPSASFFFVIVFAVLIAPSTSWPYLNLLIYPVLTTAFGVLSVAKYIYQVPVLTISDFIDDNCNVSNVSGPIPGQSFDYTFFPQTSDLSWLGLNKTTNSSEYVGCLIGVALLICFWYATKRHQAYYYSSKSITLKDWEYTSIFLELDYQQVHTSSVACIKFLVNHWFDMYGVETCFIFEAILVAVRIDVYGMVYVVILGLMLIAPRSLLPPVWLLFLCIHGLVLILQYALLVGLPPTVICKIEGYFWDSIFAAGNYPGILKWLFLPHAGSDILNKYLLYADVFVYLLICLQMRTFVFSTMKILRDRNMLKNPPYVYKTKYWFDNIKIFVFQYSFWIALFILFATAATRLSAIGLIYLLLCFIFLYRGQNLLTDIKKYRLRWWTVLRIFIWFILFLRSILQVISCVFNDSIDLSNGGTCILVSIFNIRCSKSHYYGIDDASADCGSDSNMADVGLWLDVLAFAFVTVQIILLDTSYSEQVRNNVLRKEEDAQNFADVSHRVAEDKRIKAKRAEEEDLVELKKRAEQLKLTEGKIDHFLYAGVRVPKDFLANIVTDEEPSPHHQPLEPPTLINIDDPTPHDGVDTHDNDDIDSTDMNEEPNDESKLALIKRGVMFVYSIWLLVVDSVIHWLESNSDDYRRVVYLLKQARYKSGKDVLDDERYDLDQVMSASTRSHRDPGREGATAVTIEQDSGDEEEVKSKPKDGATSIQSRDETLTTPSRSELSKGGHFDEAGDILVAGLQPTDTEAQTAQEIQSQFEDFTRRHTERPRRFMRAFYYWCLSHFEYVVFFFVVLAIITTGSFPSFIYACLLFFWGLLSLPMPTKRFWLSLIFYTMLVMFAKYIFYFISSLKFVQEKVQQDSDSYVFNQWLGIPGYNMFAWLFGISPNDTYFTNAVVNLFVLMVLMFHRGLLKQFGLWSSEHGSLSKSNFEATEIFGTVYKMIKHFFQKVIHSTSVAGRKDYYVWMLVCDVLCFVTIVFGYSSFSVTTNSGNDLIQAANYIQSNNIPIAFLIMLMLQFISMLLDRAIYVRHSVIAKLIFYIFLLVGWHVWLLLVVPIMTHNAFTNNAAAQILYLLKAIYFILSALQIISGYPTRLLGYFVGSNYSTISGILFQIYRLIPIIPELREVIDWVFTKTSLSFIHWLRVQELWAQLYQVKVRRMREKSYPRNLGEEQSLISKLLLGGGLVILLVLLIWGPLIFMSFVNQASLPNPPTSATITLELEGFQLLQIYAQNQYIFEMTSDQYKELRNKVSQTTYFSVWSGFTSLFFREDFSYILFPGNTSLIWTASLSTKQQLRSILDPAKNASLTFSWTLLRSVQGFGDETITGSYVSNITDATIQDFIDILQSDAAEHSLISLTNLYPLLVYSPNTGLSREFTELSNFVPNSTFSGTASLTTNTAYTINDTSCVGENLTQSCLENTIITEWWTLSPHKDKFLTPSIHQQHLSGNSLEMVVYSQKVSPSFLSFVASIGVIGLYVSVVFAIGQFIRGYVSSLPQNLLIDQIYYPDPLLKLCDDIFFVREMKNLVLEEVLVGKLYYIFRSPERLISLTDKQRKPKTD